LRYRSGGAKALQYRSCGRKSNRGYGKELRDRVLGRYGEQYADFGPTLAAEHLVEESWAVSAETLRRWLRESGRKSLRKRKPYRQRRERREHFGEPMQLDGSFHEWLEARGGRGCLMHMDISNNVLQQAFTDTVTFKVALDRYGQRNVDFVLVARSFKRP
jgi:hypothetical protein